MSTCILRMLLKNNNIKLLLHGLNYNLHHISSVQPHLYLFHNLLSVYNCIYIINSFHEFPSLFTSHSYQSHFCLHCSLFLVSTTLLISQSLSVPSLFAAHNLPLFTPQPTFSFSLNLTTSICRPNLYKTSLTILAPVERRADDAELVRYKKQRKWIEECRSGPFEIWFMNRLMEATSDDERRVRFCQNTPC